MLTAREATLPLAMVILGCLIANYITYKITTSETIRKLKVARQHNNREKP